MHNIYNIYKMYTLVGSLVVTLIVYLVGVLRYFKGGQGLGGTVSGHSSSHYLKTDQNGKT